MNNIFKGFPFAQGIWDRIKYNCPTPLFYEGNFLDWLEMIYKTNYTFFKFLMEKIAIIFWNI